MHKVNTAHEVNRRSECNASKLDILVDNPRNREQKDGTVTHDLVDCCRKIYFFITVNLVKQLVEYFWMMGDQLACPC
jgi:hypothetical protein